jgi:hypothetical protein
MTNSSWHKQPIWILKVNLIIWTINAFFFGVLGLSGFGFINLSISGYFSIITLLETGIAFLVGGAVAFSGSISSSKTKEYIRKSDDQWSIEKLSKSEKRANKYIILAVILFFESILISLL